jgi:hypothetical protein
MQTDIYNLLTFYELMKQQPGVSERYKKGKAKAISEVAEGLLTKAREGDTASTIFYLKTQAGGESLQNPGNVALAK